MSTKQVEVDNKTPFSTYIQQFVWPETGVGHFSCWCASRTILTWGDCVRLKLKSKRCVQTFCREHKIATQIARWWMEDALHIDASHTFNFTWCLILIASPHGHDSQTLKPTLALLSSLCFVSHKYHRDTFNFKRSVKGKSTQIQVLTFHQCCLTITFPPPEQRVERETVCYLTDEIIISCWRNPR